MDDIDLLLSIVENPTRRRILESLVREPSYPLRLSKELGISQQAVMKNLAVMESGGLVESCRVDSDMGPMRILYSPSSEFTLVVEMHSSMFSAKVIEPSGTSADIREGITREEASRRIMEIDERIAELDKERAGLISERNALTRAEPRDGQDGDQNVMNTIEKEV